jgi:hypothetical protein
MSARRKPASVGGKKKGGAKPTFSKDLRDHFAAIALRELMRVFPLDKCGDREYPLWISDVAWTVARAMMLGRSSRIRYPKGGTEPA